MDVQLGGHSIHLGSGNDTVIGSAADATVVTGAGNDSFSGQNDTYSIHAGSGDDTVFLRGGSSTIVARIARWHGDAAYVDSLFVRHHEQAATSSVCAGGLCCIIVMSE
jgi:Ca2+-binding RTX toxin-like protein